MSDTEKSEAVTLASTPAAIERPHIDMKLEDMFPESPDGASGTNLGQGAQAFVDRIPPWLYRRTEELSPEDVTKLFLPAPQNAVRKLVSFCAIARGKAYAQSLLTSVPEFVPPKPRSGRLSKLAVEIAKRFDLVPREQMVFEVARTKAQTDALVAREHLAARMKLAEEVVNEGESYIRAIFPKIDAPTRVGDRDGQRIVAVWTSEGQPDVEPEF